MRNWRWTRDNFIKPARCLTRRQKNLAKTAVLWLLRHGPHSGEEIAEHFGLAGPVVDQLLDELTVAQEVTWSAEKKYCLGMTSELKDGGNQHGRYRVAGGRRRRGGGYAEQAGGLKRPER